jgi:WD40 repeat protein
MSKIEMQPRDISSCCVRADDRTLVIVLDASSEVKLWDISSNTCIKELNTIGRYKRNQLLVNDESIVGLMDDNSFHVWNLLTGQCTRTLTIQAEQLIDVNSQHILTRRNIVQNLANRWVMGGKITYDVWNFMTGEHITSWCDNNNLIHGDAQLVANNEYIISEQIVMGANDVTDIKIRNLADFSIIRELKLTSRDQVFHVTVCVSSDTTFVVTGNYNGELKIFDFETGELMEKKKKKTKKAQKKKKKSKSKRKAKQKPKKNITKRKN